MRSLIIPTRASACSVLAMALVATVTSGATAQTLTDPNPRPAPSHSAAAKSTPAKHMKACPEYGAGFYRVDGTDACVKIGGFIEAGVGSR